MELLKKLFSRRRAASELSGHSDDEVITVHDRYGRLIQVRVEDALDRHFLITADRMLYRGE